jgi:hypothetical protein
MERSGSSVDGSDISSGAGQVSLGVLRSVGPKNHLCFGVGDDAGIPLDGSSSAGLGSPGICRHSLAT